MPKQAHIFGSKKQHNFREYFDTSDRNSWNFRSNNDRQSIKSKQFIHIVMKVGFQEIKQILPCKNILGEWTSYKIRWKT